MKPFNRSTLLFACLCLLSLLTACDHDIAIESAVDDDGSLDRTIVLYDADSAKAVTNIFNINEANGWETTIERVEMKKEEGKTKRTQNITFKKHFASIIDANDEMGGAEDTLFHIRSQFEKKHRWFYTYLEYSDTYPALNSFRAVSTDDYFTEEDYAFINRLPAEGKAISQADSLYLVRLNEKIYDIYGARTLFEELFSHMMTTLKEHNVESRWQDSLLRKKEAIFKRFQEDGGSDDGHFWSIANIFNIALPPGADDALRKKADEMEQRIDLISEVSSGKFRHAIRMPWPVVQTNADSIDGNVLYWQPPVVKFLLRDYTMTARSRRMNVWAVAASSGVVVLTLALFFIRKR